MHILFRLSIFALAFLWIFTGLTSLFWAREIGYEVLEKSGITGSLADIAVYGGAITDISIGLWLLSFRLLQLCCIVQLVVIAIFTLLLSFIDPSFWLHPFGPVSKNIPIIMLILWLQYYLKSESKP